MPAYLVTAPDGRKLRIEGPTPPSESELDEIFKSAPAPAPAPVQRPLPPGIGRAPGESERVFRLPNIPSMEAPAFRTDLAEPPIQPQFPERPQISEALARGPMDTAFGTFLPKSVSGARTDAREGVNTDLLRKFGIAELLAAGPLGQAALRFGPKDLPEKIGAAGANFGSDMVESTLSPGGLATLGTGGLARTLGKTFLQKVLPLAFSTTMAPTMGEKLGTASATGDPQDIAEAGLATGLTVAPALPAMLGRVDVPITMGDRARMLAREINNAPLMFEQPIPATPGFAPAQNVRTGITGVDPNVLPDLPPGLMEQGLAAAGGPEVLAPGQIPALEVLRRQRQAPPVEGRAPVARPEPTAAPGETVVRTRASGLQVEPGFQRSASDLLLERKIAELEADPHVAGQRFVRMDENGRPVFEPVMQDVAKVRQLENLRKLRGMERMKELRSPLSAEEFERQRARREARANVAKGLTIEEQPGFEVAGPEPAGAPGPLPEGQPLSNLQKERLEKAVARGADAETLRNILRLPEGTPFSVIVQQAQQAGVPLRGQTVVKPRAPSPGRPGGPVQFFDRPGEVSMMGGEQAPTIESIRAQRATERRAAVKAKPTKEIILQEWNEGEDGHWIQLKDGWEVDGSTAIHEFTRAKARARIKDAKYVGVDKPIRPGGPNQMFNIADELSIAGGEPMAPTVEQIRANRALEERKANAARARTEPVGGEPEHQRTAPREDVRENAPEVRGEESPETVGGNRPDEGGAVAPSKVIPEADLKLNEVGMVDQILIKNANQAHPESNMASMIETVKQRKGVTQEAANAIVNELRTLPDPMAVLDRWRQLKEDARARLQEAKKSGDFAGVERPGYELQGANEALEIIGDHGERLGFSKEVAARAKELRETPDTTKMAPKESLPPGEQSTAAKTTADTTGGVPPRETPAEAQPVTPEAISEGREFTVDEVTPLEPASGVPLSATDALINKLEAMKLPDNYRPRATKVGAFGYLPHAQEVAALGTAVWNKAIDVTIAAIKAGRSVAEAINSAIQYAKTNAKGFDEAKVRANLEYIVKNEPGLAPVGAGPVPPAGGPAPAPVPPQPPGPSVVGAPPPVTPGGAGTPSTAPPVIPAGAAPPAGGAPPVIGRTPLSGSNVRMRNLSERGTTAPSLPPVIQTRLRTAPNSFYFQQNQALVRQAVRAMSDLALDNIPDTSEVYTAAKLELVNRHLAAGRNDIAYQVYQDLSANLTRHGQIVNQAKLLQALNPSRTLAIVNASLRKGGYDPLTPQQSLRMRVLSKNRIDTQRALDIATSDWVQNPSQANAIRAEQALNVANRAALNEQRMVHQFQNRSMTGLLKSILQGNLLTPISQVANVFGNMNFAPFRAATRGIASGVDMIDAFLRNRPREVSVGGTGETIGGVMKGLKQIPDIMMRGQGDVIKGEVRSGLHPLRAWINQFARNPDVPTVGGRIPLMDRVKMAIEGTIGVPAEMMLRGLGSGDIAFREGARARLIAEQSRLNNVSAANRRMAQNFPELFFDDATLTQINNETMAAIFQKHSPAIDAIMSWSKKSGGLADLAISTVAPYKLTPWNIIGEILSYNPAVSIAKAAIEGKKGNIRAAEVNAAKFVVGSTLIGAATWLYNKGLLSPSMDARDEQQKARILAGEVMPPNHINISGLKRALTPGASKTAGNFRKGDETRDVFRAGGLAGSMFYMTANIGRDLETKPAADAAVMSILKNSTLEQARFGLNQTFLKGVTSLLDAVQDGDADTYLQSYANTVLSVPLPNTLSTLSRATRKYKVDVKADTFAEQIGNVAKTRLGFLGLDDYLPLKRGLWGEPMRETPKNRNELLFHFFDITKGQQVTDDATNLELYRLWRKTADTQVIPTPPEKVMTRASRTYPLDTAQRSRLAELVGQARRPIVDRMVINPNWAPLTDEQKVNMLKRAYNMGLELGKNRFWNEAGAQLEEKPARAGFTAQ